jgi:hypothetical protein
VLVVREFYLLLSCGLEVQVIMSEQSEMTTSPPNDQNSAENVMDVISQNETETSSENNMAASQTKNDSNKGSRYAKTFQALQQMGLLDYAMQLATLCKENEQLQQKINKLEMEVNESSQKTKPGLKEKLQQVSQTANTTDDVPTT